MRHAVAILFFALLVSFSGCVPPGEPPEGVIVSNPRRASMGRKQAGEALVAGFTMFVSSHMRNSDIYCVAPCELQTLANEMLSEARMVAGVRVVPSARLVLELSAADNVWTALLKDDGNVVWTDSVEITGGEEK